MIISIYAPPRRSLKPYMQLSWETIITSLESANTESASEGMRGRGKRQDVLILIYGLRPTAKR